MNEPLPTDYLLIKMRHRPRRWVVVVGVLAVLGAAGVVSWLWS